ncbi:MAG: ATP-grasp domain-containing protein [Pseudomonadota bacterium]
MRNESVPPSLAREGNLMVQALVADLLETPGVKVTILRDRRISWPENANGDATKIVWVEERDDLKRMLRELMERSDAVWPIAPETDGELEKFSESALRADKILLNSPPKAVRTAASKLATTRFLEQRGVPVVSAHAFPQIPEHWQGPWVVKPDDGVGCEGSRILGNREELSQVLGAENRNGAIIQPYVKGDPVSISAIFHQGRAQLLSCNRQRIAIIEQRFRLNGCQVNAIDAGNGNYRQITEAVAAALPELWGYAGIDLIETDEGLRVLEINPRLTTSYAGLRRATGINPAAYVLNLVHKGRLPHPLKPARRVVEINLESFRVG